VRRLRLPAAAALTAVARWDDCRVRRQANEYVKAAAARALRSRDEVWAPELETPAEVWVLAHVLHRAASARGSRGRPRRVRSVVHVSPAQFSDDSIMGGGERAAWDLARAVSKRLPTTLVSFGDARWSGRRGELRVEIFPARRFLNAGYDRYDPLSYRFLGELRRADAVHCNQFRVAVSQLAILAAAALGKHVFVTDRGGVGCHFDPVIPVGDYVDRFLLISEFSRRMVAPGRPVRIIPGGVNPAFLVDGAAPARAARRVLYVGRVMRHKGLDNLIAAIDETVGLDVVGRVYDDEYFDRLRRLAEGKDVRFFHDATDEDVARAYREALVTVLPSVYEDCFGGHQSMPELLGRVLLESMASGTPVVCTAVGGMPEVVEHGENGFVVPPNDPVALRAALRRLAADPQLRDRMGANGRDRVLARFTWEGAAQDTVAAYAGSASPRGGRLSRRSSRRSPCG
jgi:glycosyltransferase involved in cell wall biosynthesis